jgi:hypothetical protein
LPNEKRLLLAAGGLFSLCLGSSLFYSIITPSRGGEFIQKAPMQGEDIADDKAGGEGGGEGGGEEPAGEAMPEHLLSPPTTLPEEQPNILLS